jgi:hypothetical protein
MLLPALALAAAIVPAPVFAQSAMSHDTMMPPAMATYACRQVSDKDSSAMMSQNHEVAATTTDGTKLVCMTLSGMHDKMMAQKMAAAKAKDPADASQQWVDYTMRYLSVPF